jgi:hypothetical protein
MESNWLVWVMLLIALGGIVGLTVWLGFLTQNKDNASEIQKSLTIVSVITVVIVGLFGAAAYIYLSANVAYATPFILVMTFVNLALSTIAVSVASLNTINS